MGILDRIKQFRRQKERRKPAQSKQSAQKAAERLKQVNQAHADLARTRLTYPVTNLNIQRHGTRLFRSATLSMNGFPSEQESQVVQMPRISGRHDFLMGILDGHNGGTAAVSLKGLIDGKFPGMKLDSENITKAMIWFDQQYNNKTMFRDGTTCCLAYGQPWNALTDERIIHLEQFFRRNDPKKQPFKAAPLNPTDNEEAYPSLPNDPENYKVIDPHAEFPDDFVLKLLTVNLGNSKAMLIRPNGNWIAITEDHTCNNRKERNRILKAGGVIVDGKINGRHPITRSIGDKLYKSLQGVPALDQMVVPLPDFEEHIMLPGDMLLLSCDGLFQGKNMDFSTVAGLIADSARSYGRHFDPAVVLRDLFEVSLEQGSFSNHSATLLHFANGLQFVQPPLLETEMIPGPLPKMQGIDREPATAPRFRYIKTYVADLMRNGYTLDDVHEYHKAHRDLEIVEGDNDIKPIIYKGDIAQQIAAEDAERIKQGDYSHSEDGHHEEEEEEYDSNASYAQQHPHAVDDPVGAARMRRMEDEMLKSAGIDSKEKHGMFNQPRHVTEENRLLREVRFKRKNDPGSTHNQGQLDEILRDTSPWKNWSSGLMDEKHSDSLPPINPAEFSNRAPNLTDYPPQPPASRTFWQQIRDNVTGGKKN